MAIPTFNILSICTGLGMLYTGVLLALERRGIAGRVVGCVEREACAASALVARMEAEAAGAAPVWDDIATFDGRPWRGCVDCLTAGLPCQPYSLAGKRAGNTDNRSWGASGGEDGPVFHTVRIIDEVRPAVVFFENVPAWVTGGHFRRFGEALCGLGYEIKDPIFLAAEDTGAPHRRERVFVLAVNQGGRFAAWRESSRCNRQLNGGYEGLAHEQRQRRQGDRPAPPRGGSGEQPTQCGSQLGDGPSARHSQTGGGKPLKSVGRWGVSGDGGVRITLYPPGRGDESNPDHPDFRAWAAIAELGPTRMPAIESRVPVVVDGLAFANADLLRIGGNGVVPLAAAIAFDALFFA